MALPYLTKHPLPDKRSFNILLNKYINAVVVSKRIVY